MNDQQIKQAAIDELSKLAVATFLYKFTVTQFSDNDGVVCAVNSNGYEWFLYYEIADDRLRWIDVEISRFATVTA